MAASPQARAKEDYQSAGIFEGVFATRGGAESSEATPSGVFEKVFVKRGRWRKGSSETSPQSHGNVLHLAEHVNASAPDIEYPMPSLSDVTDRQLKTMDPILEDSEKSLAALLADGSDPTLTSEITDTIQYIVKNTFLNTSLVRDSLKEFLSERLVQSCPAGSIGIDDIAGMDDVGSDAESTPNDAILNTASTWQNLRTMSFDDPSFMPETLWKGLPFNTASTFGGGEADGLQRGISEVLGMMRDPDEVYNTASTFGGDKIGQTALQLSTTQQRSAAGLEPAVNPPMQFVGMEAPCFPLPPCAPPAVNASMMQMPPPPAPFETAPVASAVLRLAEALPPPELGGPLAPSVGSLLHHVGECKPCTFFHTRGCENKESCQFCHLCAPGEKKKRLRAEKRAKREAQVVAVQNARAILASLDAVEGNSRVDFIVE